MKKEQRRRENNSTKERRERKRTRHARFKVGEGERASFKLE